MLPDIQRMEFTRKAEVSVFQGVRSHAIPSGFRYSLQVRAQTTSGSSKLIEGLTPKCLQCFSAGSRKRYIRRLSSFSSM